MDFSALASSTDVVTILSTEPLTTDEQWQPFQPGESMLLVHGECRRRSLGSGAPAGFALASR